MYEISHEKQGVVKGEGVDGMGGNVDHPNVWFEKSWGLERGEAEKVEEKKRKGEDVVGGEAGGDEMEL